MLLIRSSSTPVLKSLLGPLPHNESLVEPKIEAPTTGDCTNPKCFSLTKGSSTSSQGCHSPGFLASHDSWVAELGSRSFRPIRKVQSDSDLSSLSAGSFSSARVAACSVFSDDDSLDVNDHEESPCPLLKKRSSTSLPLSRRRSLGSLSMEFPSVFDGDLTIVEEVESGASSSALSEEEGESIRTCVFDKIALPVSRRDAFELPDADSVRWQLSDDDDVDKGMSEKLLDKLAMPLRYGEEMLTICTSKANAVTSCLEQHDSERSLFLSRYSQGGSSGKYLVKEASGKFLESQHLYSESQAEMAFGAGDGGRGARTPPITGGEGGNGDAFGSGADLTDLHYQNMLTKNPGHPLLLRNYAHYLGEVKHDYRKAEEYFQRAILANPSDGELLGQYAKMIWEVQQDRERAATYFEQAVQAAPDNSYVTAAYASFLWNSEDEDGEEELKGAGTSTVPSIFSLVSAGLA